MAAAAQECPVFAGTGTDTDRAGLGMVLLSVSSNGWRRSRGQRHQSSPASNSYTLSDGMMNELGNALSKFDAAPALEVLSRPAVRTPLLSSARPAAC